MTRNDNINWDQTPLHGVLLCCTSIPIQQRDAIAAAATQMGAVHKVDLTADVTHLIVGHTDTPKYRYVAKERPDIKVLGPDWLDAVRDSWLQGGETDVLALEEAHKLSPLSGLQICVTGFDNLKERNDIAEAVEANGARYHGDLTKQVTHLIAASPKGKKYEYAGQWGVKIIAIEWLRDTIERGMVLDETLYSPITPIEERGRGAVSQRRPQAASRKRSRDGESQAEAGNGGRRKLRRTTSSKLQSQSGELWADIGTAEKESEDLHVDQWAELSRQAPAPTRTPGVQTPDALHAGECDSRLASDDEVMAVTKDVPVASRDKIHIFQNQSLSILGFDDQKTKILHDLVASNGADLLSRADLDSRAIHLGDYTAEKSNHDRNNPITYVVPHDISSSKLANIKDQPFVHAKDDFVTYWWVEKCIYLKTSVDKEGPLCKPLDKLPIRGFENLTICPTSFAGIDLRHLSKAVKLAGAHYDEYLRETTSVLVCNNGTMPNAQKLRYALEHQIPVVRSDWIWDCINTGQYVPAAGFSLTARRSASGNERQTLKRTETAPAVPTAVAVPVLSAGIGGSKDKPTEKPHSLQSLHPLKELDTDVNASKKGSQASSAKTSSSDTLAAPKADARDTDFSAEKMDESGGLQTRVDLEKAREDDKLQSTRLSDAIAELRAHRVRDTLTSHQNQTATSDRRHRPLGRAISNPSSLGGGSGPTLDPAGSRPVPASRNEEGIAEEREQSDKPRPLHSKHSESFTFHPSQALTYEMEESAKTREMLTERMGLGGSDERMRQDDDRDTRGGMQRVESIGKVKDLVPAAAGAAEGAGRRRQRRAVRPT